MARQIELRRHTDDDGDVLSPDGVEAAVAVGGTLEHRYDVVVTSGAQRATQTAACFLAAGATSARGVTVDPRFRSEHEDRWREIYGEHQPDGLGGFREADPEFVDSEAERFAAALRDLLRDLPDGGRALVVGHSPTQEAAVYGLTGEVVDSLGKGEGVLIVEDDGFRVEPLD